MRTNAMKKCIRLVLECIQPPQKRHDMGVAIILRKPPFEYDVSDEWSWKSIWGEVFLLSKQG